MLYALSRSVFIKLVLRNSVKTERLYISYGPTICFWPIAESDLVNLPPRDHEGHPDSWCLAFDDDTEL